jgi:aryl-alcohol dehydrogenase-like predicted oxidoreductase
MIEQVRLGSSGLCVSRLALGMMSFGDTSRRAWVLDEPAAEPIVRRAIDAGITLFDTADMYAGGASEALTGRRPPSRRTQRALSLTRCAPAATDSRATPR